MLVLRFLGLVFMNKRKLIIYQIIIIYGYMLVALTTWEAITIKGTRQLPSTCFRPLKMASLNLVLMALFYIFVLAPLWMIVLLLPIYMTKLYKNVKAQRRKKLMKHYLIKAMPSVLFRKELFQGNQNQMVECGICLEEFNEKEYYVTPLYCKGNHMFHSNCIETWFEKQNQCPLCRTE